MQNELIITNARVLLPQQVLPRGTVTVRDGLVHRVDSGRSWLPQALDADGHWLLPGLVELQGELPPRLPGQGPLAAAVRAHDAALAAAGITTVLQLVDGEPAIQPLPQVLDALRAAGALRADHHLHLRGAGPGAEAPARHPRLALVSLPGRGLAVGDGPAPALAAWARAQGVALAGHGHTTAGEVEAAHALGAVLSLQPGSLAAAQRAGALGLCTVAGVATGPGEGAAPEPVPALALARAGLLGALCGARHPALLLQAALALHREAGHSLPEAVALVSAAPARLCGLHDRGQIGPGRRADLLRVRELAGQPVVVQVWRAGERVA